MGKTHCFSIIG